MSTQKGPKMTLKMSTGRNKIPLHFILRVYFSIFWGTKGQRLRSLKNVNFIVCKIVIARVRSVKILLLLVKQMLGRGHT